VRIWGVNGAPGGKIELMTGVRGCVLDGPQEGFLGAAAARVANARTASFIGAMVACWS
jgi:hypothetical protein